MYAAVYAAVIVYVYVYVYVYVDVEEEEPRVCTSVRVYGYHTPRWNKVNTQHNSVRGGTTPRSTGALPS